MRYMGGKTRQAKHIVRELLARKGDNSAYLEPFMGGGSILTRMAEHFQSVTAADVHQDLILAWQAVATGWVPPETVSREEWYSLKNAKPSALRGFVGFGCSFGGRWFQGYATAEGRNFSREAREALLKKAPSLGHVTFVNASYESFSPGPGTLVYCDPPYVGTKPYAGTPKFDTALFWSTMREWADAGATVLVSEYSAPEWAEEVWARDAVVSLNRERSTHSVERLFLVPPTPVSDPAPESGGGVSHDQDRGETYMQYMGGKTRQAKHIETQLLKYKGDCVRYIEPFMGGGAIFARMAPHFPDAALGSDIHPDLMLMWQALQDCWDPPTEITREDWYVIKDQEPSALRGFVGFGCSFGGRWFEGYASNRGGRNFCDVARRGVLRKAAGMRRANFLQAPYTSLAPGPGTLVYCDPPYASTKPYSGTDKFDTDLFWTTVRGWANAGATVLVSEYTAPDWAEEVWRRDAVKSLNKDANATPAVERLFLVPPTPVSDPAPTVEVSDAEESSMEETAPGFVAGPPAPAEVSHWQQQAREAAARHLETTAEEFMDPAPGWTPARNACECFCGRPVAVGDLTKDVGGEESVYFVCKGCDGKPLEILNAPAPVQAVTPVTPDAFMDPAAPEETPAANVSGQPDPRYEWWGEQNRGYLVKLPETGDFRRYKNGRPKGITRATTFNKAASDTTSLTDWKLRNVIVGASRRPDLLLRAHGLDVQRDSKVLNKLAAELEAVAGAKVGADIGTFLHEFCEHIDAGLKTWRDAPEVYQAQLRLYSETLAEAGFETVPGMIERTTYIAEFGGVVGRFDRILFHRPSGKYMIADLKTGRTMDYARLENECQEWIYAHGVNEHGVYDWNTDTWAPMLFDSMNIRPFKVSETVGLIIHMPVQGDDAGQVILEKTDLQRGKRYAATCAENRGWVKPKRELWSWEPEAAAEEAPEPAPRFKRSDWRTRFRAVTSREEANALYKQAKAEGVPVSVLGDLVVIGKEALASLANKQEQR